MIEDKQQIFLEYVNLFSKLNKEQKCNEILEKQKVILEFLIKYANEKNIQYKLIGGENSLIGNYNEKINVDMKIQDKYYKIINSNDSNISTYIPTIKMWMMNALELKENKEELIFIVNEQIIDEKINTFIMMLEKYGKVVKMSKFNDYFNNYK